MINKELEDKIKIMGTYLTPFTIAYELGLDENEVVEICNYYGYNKRCKNINISIGELENQIILSGIIGDGRIKINGKSGSYYYSECHAMDEREYCEWKYFNLGQLTQGMKMYGKNFNNNSSNAIEFVTKSTPLLKSYYDMPISEVIYKLNYIGLMLLILDDGWFSTHSKCGNFLLSGGLMTLEELNILCNKYRSIGIDCNIIGKKRYDISFSSYNNLTILNYLSMFINMNIDVINKKFNHIFKTLLDVQYKSNVNNMLVYL